MKFSVAAIAFIIFTCFGCSNQPQQQTIAAAPKSATAKPLQHIYLTFDDGPLEGSEDINDAVSKEQIKVNVFVVGQHALSSERMRSFYKLYENNPWIEIGNHSFSHAHDHYKKFYKQPDSVVADFMKCQALLHIPNKLARQPGRNQWRLKDTSINDVSSGAASADLLFKKGFRVFGWDLEWQHDVKTGAPIQTVTDMFELIEKKFNENKTVTPGNLVLLAHDEMFRNGWEESELKQLIDTLESSGKYSFEHLSNYPE